MIMEDKIGVGIITCDRNDFLRNLIKSLPPKEEFYHYCLIVDGEEDVDQDLLDDFFDYNITSGRAGVGVSKNWALMQMYALDCDHIFLIEDDMIIKNQDVFNEYIRVAKKTGLKHFNFGYHGPANKKNGLPNPRRLIEYDENTIIALNQHCVGSFSYYHRDCITECGLMDFKFKNAWEHVEHTFRLHKAGFTTPFWWFADIHNSYEYIGEQACSEENSTIRKTTEWYDKLKEGAEYFNRIHGHYPVNIPDTPEPQVRRFLIENIRK